MKVVKITKGYFELEDGTIIEHIEPLEEVLVQNDLWEVFAGYDVFDELLVIFEEIGAEVQQEVEDFLNNKQR